MHSILGLKFKEVKPKFDLIPHENIMIIGRLSWRPLWGCFNLRIACLLANPATLCLPRIFMMKP